MGEEDRTWEVKAGQALLLRPDAYHYSSESCREQTHFFWLHFYPANRWEELIEEKMAQSDIQIHNEQEKEQNRDHDGASPHPYTNVFALNVSRYCELSQPVEMYEYLRSLNDMRRQSNDWARLQQQVLCLQILQNLAREQPPQSHSTLVQVAEKAATYLRMHYQEDMTYDRLGQALNYHPIYVAKCMRKVFHLSPLEYLVKYRLEQAKLLLLTTDRPVARIAEEVGFQHASYFSKCFISLEKVSPREFRKKFQAPR